MKDEKFDDEMVRQMLNWLSRNVEADGNFPDAHALGELALTEEDHHFLRQLKIAISLDERARLFAN